MRPSRVLPVLSVRSVSRARASVGARLHRCLRAAVVVGAFVVAPSLAAQRVREGTVPDTTADGHALIVVVNIPASVLTLYDDSTPVVTYRVSPGRVLHETPTGTYTIRQVIWNPDWHPPDSDWASDEHYTPPGPGNPMGRVKLPIDDDVLYIHGSPAKNSIGHPASHGCIRMLNTDAIALARALIARAAPRIDSATVDRVLAHPSRTTYMKLQTGVQVRVVYAVAQVHGDSLWVYADPYRSTRLRDTRARVGAHGARPALPLRVAEAIAALRDGGVPLASIDTAGLLAREHASGGALFVVPRSGPSGRMNGTSAPVTESRLPAPTVPNAPGASAPIRSVRDLIKRPHGLT
jgi:hypothetical protein